MQGHSHSPRRARPARTRSYYSSDNSSNGCISRSRPSCSYHSESRPLLHHHQHSHRVQPYQPHNRQQSRTAHQLTQQLIDDMQQHQQPPPTSPLPNSPPASTALSFPPPFVLSLHSLSDLGQALQLSEHLIVLLFIVTPTSASSASLSRLYHQLASSALYRNLLFVSVDSSLLASAASFAASTGSSSPAPLLLPVTLPPPPALQLYYAGTCIGEVGNVNEEQLMTIVQSSDELMQHIAANGGSSSTEDDESAYYHEQQQQQRAQDSPSGRVHWEEGEEEEGVLLSADEAVALEKLVLRDDADVLQAYAAFPELSLVVDAFMRIAKHVGREKEARRRRVGHSTAATATAAASAASSTLSSLPALASQRPAAASSSRELDDLLSMTLSALPAARTAVDCRGGRSAAAVRRQRLAGAAHVAGVSERRARGAADGELAQNSDGLQAGNDRTAEHTSQQRSH